MDDGVLSVEICAPEKERLQLRATEAIVPGAAGVFAVHAGHTPLLSTLVPGALIVKGADGQTRFFAVHGGFAEVRGDHVLILASNYELAEDIDAGRAEAAEERAEERLQRPTPDLNWARAEAALARAIARLRASRRANYL